MASGVFTSGIGSLGSDHQSDGIRSSDNSAAILESISIGNNTELRNKILIGINRISQPPKIVRNSTTKMSKDSFGTTKHPRLGYARRQIA